MRRRPGIAVLILLIMMVSSLFSTVMAGNGDTIWNGYDIEVLNTYDIQLVGQSSTIEINGDKLLFSGEYIIKNHTDKTLEAILGLPSNRLENVQVSEKGNPVKHYNRNGSYIKDKYPSEDLPEVEKWHTVSLWFKSGETKIISLRYETTLINDSKGIYGIRFNKSPGLVSSDASTITIALNDFFPYNVLDTIGITKDKVIFSSNNRLIMEMNKISKIIGLDYELVDNLSIDRLDFSSDKKLKSIAAAFRKKDYDSVNTLCDEYISNPSDPSFSIAQVKYVKAEAYRKKADFEKYIEMIKELDLGKLYPDRLKYKILYDLDQILEGNTQDIKLLSMIESLQSQATDSNEFISTWMKDNSRSYTDIVETVKPEIEKESEQKEESLFAKTVKLMKLEGIVKKIIDFKYLPIIVIVIAFLLGYFLGRRNKKRRRDIPYYTYKR